jgi:oxaloacetate decarboxylase gamma subunit
MEEVNLVFEGLKFMILGMGTVFTFLIILIFSMNFQAKIISKYFPEPEVAPTPASPVQENKNSKIAAITAAITHHKQLNS